MSLTIAQRLDSLKARTAELAHWRDRQSVEIDGWTFDGEPIAHHQDWPHRKGTVHFSASAKAPADWPLDKIRLQLDLGGESLVTLNYGGEEAETFGLDPYHQEFPVRGREFSISTESVARFPFGEPNRAPRLNKARLIWLDEPVHRLHLLLRQITEAVDVLDGHEAVAHMIEAAEQGARQSRTGRRIRQPMCPRTSGAFMQQKIWELPELQDHPAGARRPAERHGAGSFRYADDQTEGTAEALPAEWRTAFDRPRPYRSRLAVAV